MTQIACQMYTLRDFTKTPADLAKTLSRVKKIGYDAVQLSAHGPIEAKDLAKIMSDEGLICCATHTPLEQLRDQPQQVIDEHEIWKCKYTAIGGFFPKNPTAQTWRDFIGDFNSIAKKFAGSGLSIGYHNHSHELAHYDGKPALATMIEKLDREIWIEIDTYWIAHGGGDPVDWISRVSKRIPCVHWKDMGVRNDRTQFMAEIGTGNLNWPAILRACKSAGVQWYIIEQDDCNGRDPFESIAISLRNAQAMGLS